MGTQNRVIESSKSRTIQIYHRSLNMDSRNMNFDHGDGDAAFKQLDADFMGVLRTTIGEQKTLWDVEDNFDKDPWVTWLRARWMGSFVYATIYVVGIFGGQYLMKKRERFELTLTLTLWNVVLAGFSIMGAIRCTSELFYTLTNKGVHDSIVDMSFYDGPSGLWVLLFTLSKLMELGDTVFIVLRKTNLIFLHWYHHIATLIYCWNAYAEQTGTGRWFVAMNFCVHSLMYSYYALRALKFKIPRFVMVTITGLQTIQIDWRIAQRVRLQPQNSRFASAPNMGQLVLRQRHVFLVSLPLLEVFLQRLHR